MPEPHSRPCEAGCLFFAGELCCTQRECAGGAEGARTLRADRLRARVKGYATRIEKDFQEMTTCELCAQTARHSADLSAWCLVTGVK